ncbi:MAG: hypothetical protein JWR34_882 [Mycobacterium sp.]|nr:hypothetical protein [Mycobacterium sp.]
MKDTWYQGARLIIGNGAQPVENSELVVRGGRIEYAGPAISGNIDAGSHLVDLTGKTIMPTIVNPHGHIGYMKNGVADKAYYSRANVLDHLRRLAYYGVGVFQSLGTDRDDMELTLRDEQRAGTLEETDLATLLTAGAGLVAAGDGSPNGGPFFATDVVVEVSDSGTARQRVRELAAKGPDAIKFWVDDRWGTRAKPSPDVCSAIIDEAHTLGVKAIAHIYTLEDAMIVARAGVDGIAHMVRSPGTTPELIDILNANNIFAFTSLSIQRPDGEEWLDDPALAETVSLPVIERAKEAIRSRSPEDVRERQDSYVRLEEGLREYVNGGVRIVLSADTGLLTQFVGFAEHRELEAMVHAGMPVLAAIRAATQVPAEILELPDRGTLERGKQADFIVLNSNPIENIANTRDIAAVYLKGSAVDRASLRRMWASEPTELDEPTTFQGFVRPRS